MNYQSSRKFAAVALIAATVAFCVAVVNLAIVLGSHQRVPKYAPYEPDLTDLCTAFSKWKQMTGDDEPGMSKRCKGE